MPHERVEFFGVPPSRLAEHLEGPGRARDAWRVVRRGEDPLAPGALPASSQERLRSRCLWAPLALRERRVARDGTVKLLLGLRDGLLVETVVIPGRGRTTVCLSTQVGCARGCTFCVTATLGLLRSLSAAEITAQVHFAQREVTLHGLPPLRNVVTMGMGEPLCNLEALGDALAVLTDPWAFGIGPRRITVSTVGPSPRAIAAAAALPAALAWSLHSADDDVRRRLIPTARHPVAALRDAFAEVLQARDEVLFVENTLIDGLNDGDDDARGVARFLRPLGVRARLNLLPLNAGRGGLRRAPPARVARYRQILIDEGYRCLVRQERGGDEHAACGQLAARSEPVREHRA